MASRWVVAIAGCCMFATGAWSGRVQGAEAYTLAQIVQQQQELRTRLDAGDVGELTPRRVRVIRKAQDQVFQLSSGKSQLEELNVEERVQMENALEAINAEVVGTRSAQENQDVCWTEAKTGSKMKVTRCGTQEEIDEARRGARAWMEKPKICVPPGCGS